MALAINLLVQLLVELHEQLHEQLIKIHQFTLSLLNDDDDDEDDVQWLNVHLKSDWKPA